MRLQAGVKSIAYGGRPTNKRIQAVGGTKGANNYPYNFIKTLASVPLNDATPAQFANWTALRAYTDLAQNRSTDNSLNVRDQILRPNLGDGIPAQFIYEEADCRLFWEPGMISDVKAIWKKAADAAWGGATCVAGNGLGARENLSARHRKSQELKIRSKRDIRIPFHKTWLKSIAWNNEPTSPIHGRKVPL